MRCINNDYSSSLKKLLSQTKTEPLLIKRLKLVACEVFRIVNKLSPEYIQGMISIKNSTYNFRGERKADIPRVNTTRYGLGSFMSEAPRIWNSLPNNLRRQSHTCSSEGCSRDGMALDVDALCVVPIFCCCFFCFLFMCYHALLCLLCLLFLLFKINFIHYLILLYTCDLEIFAVKTT